MTSRVAKLLRENGMTVEEYIYIQEAEIRQLAEALDLYENYCKEQGYIPSKNMMDKIAKVRKAKGGLK